MAAKKRTAKRAAPRRAYAAPRRKTYRRKSGTSMIPQAMTTVGLVAANLDPIKTVISDMSLNGFKNAAQQAIQVAQLKKTAIYTIGGMLAGEAVKRYAPAVIKAPLGKIAKKIPKVF